MLIGSSLMCHQGAALIAIELDKSRGEIEMAKIKIKDLPRDKKVSKEEMKQVKGGRKVTVKFGKPIIHSS
jgi:hypothetical protein